MKYLIYIYLLVFLGGCGSDGTEKYYIKTVSFDKNLPIDEKVKIAAHVIPEKKQLDWQKLEMTAFIHFTINTFTNMEWGHGDESPEIFNPTDLNAEQWVKTLKDAGMKMVILTCKHHDGFCLWPTKTTTHSVASSPWKNGKGDVVKEVKEACEKYDMKFGVYLSPWDRNASCYGDSPAYNKFFLKQLKELLTNYGKVDEVWFDGANGEGPNGKKQIYDWGAYYSLINELQPQAVVAVKGEDVRWVGTESGYGRETEWSVTPLAPGGREENVAINKALGIKSTTKDLGSRKLLAKADHLFWYPAEVDVSIRPGWFFHEAENSRVKSLDKLVDIYFNSVGKNAVLLLNVPPDTRGLIHEIDVKRLKEFGEYIHNAFSNDLVIGANVSKKEAKRITDGNIDTYWDIQDLPATVEINFNENESFNVIMLQEYIKKGQRVELFKVEAFIDGKWQAVCNSTTIGYKKLLRFNKVNTSKIKLTILKARDGALISRIGVFYVPEILSDPVIIRDKKGVVSIGVQGSSTNAVITYTTNGAVPDRHSKKFNHTFLMSGKGIVKARAYFNDMKDSSAVVISKFDICPAKWSVVSFSDDTPQFKVNNAIDGDIRSMWHTSWQDGAKDHPHFIVVDMGEIVKMKGFTYTPRTGTNKSGTIFRYNFYVSKDGKKWIKVLNNAEFGNIKNNPNYQEVMFDKIYNVRYFKFESLEGIYNEKWVSVGELGVLTK